MDVMHCESQLMVRACGQVLLLKAAFAALAVGLAVLATRARKERGAPAPAERSTAAASESAPAAKPDAPEGAEREGKPVTEGGSRRAFTAKRSSNGG